MLISSIVNKVDGLKLISDGEFTSLGLAVSKCNEKLLSFIENEKYISSLGENITCLITTEKLAEKLKDEFGVIISSNPRMDYFKLHNTLAIENSEYRLAHLQSEISPSASVAKTASISSNNVTIGENVIIEDNVIIRENVEVKAGAIIRAGCILGGEGFEFKRVDGIIMNVIHCGKVVIEENVELQYGTAVDKALYPWDSTIVGSYSKLDNFVHIEHGVKIGRRCLIASRSTIGGRTIIGDDSWIGLGAIISNGLIIGKNAYISLGAVVTKRMKNSEKVSGNFAINHDKFIEHIKKLR